MKLRTTLLSVAALSLVVGCADTPPEDRVGDDVPDASAPDAASDDAQPVDVAVPDAQSVDVASVDVTHDAVVVDAPAVDAAVDAPAPLDASTTDASAMDAVVDAPAPVDVRVVDASSDAARDVNAVDARVDASVDAGGDDASDAGAAGRGFAPSGSDWVVPPNGLSDGFYAANLATGTRWWSLLDMNGDGRPDLVQTGDPTRTGGYVFGAGTSSPSWRVFLNTGAGFATTPIVWTLPDIGLSDVPYSTNLGTGTRWWSTLDLNGDNRPDLVQTGDPTRTGGYVFGAGTASPSWRVFLNTGTGFATTATVWAVPNIGLSDGPYSANLATGTRWWSTLDLNGDNRPDLVQTGDPARTGGYVFGAGTASPTWRVFLNTGSGFAMSATAWTVPDIGLSDGPYSTNLNAGTRWWSTVDLNGDNRPDLVQTGDPTRAGGYVFGAGTASPSWRVFVNTGTGFASTATVWAVPDVGLSDGPYATALNEGTRWWGLFDLDGDRRPEFVQTGDPTRTGGYVFGAGTSAPAWRFWSNTGSGFVRASTRWSVPEIGLSDGPYAASLATGTRWWITVDMNGDGRADFAQTGDPTRSGGYVFGAGTSSLSWRVFLAR